jgi:signal transduction histidine kinase
MGLINLIHTEQNPEVIGKYVGLIENRINKLDDFIKSVLSHSKSINSPICLSAIDFNKIINECTDELRYLKNADKLNICVQLQEEIPFHSDALRLTILFKNFISNAIKFLNPQAGQSYLSITVQTTAGCTRIILADNGIGIDQEYIKKIYDMFFRATESSDGSGLGLYIVKQNIETLQGNIEVESQLNKGTTFTITLPNLVNAVADKEAVIV